MNERAANEGFVPLGKRRGSSFRGQRDAATDTAAELGGVSSQHFLKEQVLRGPAGTLPPRASRADLKSAQEGALYYSLRERIPVDLAATPGAGGQALRRAARAGDPRGAFSRDGGLFFGAFDSLERAAAPPRPRDETVRVATAPRRRRAIWVEPTSEDPPSRKRRRGVAAPPLPRRVRRDGCDEGREASTGRLRRPATDRGAGDREIVGGSAVAQTAFCAGKFCLVRLRARGLRSGPS